MSASVAQLAERPVCSGMVAGSTPAAGSKWIDHIEKGDVIEEGNGTLRVVRAVHRFVTRRGNLYTSVTLAIRRPSWTSRPYTVINCHDMRQRGFKPTGAKWPLNSEFDRALEAEFGRVPRGCLSARDIKGIA